MLNDVAEGAMVTDQLQCRLRAHTFDRLKIVTTKKDAKVDKLSSVR